jgi:hypothetical protein
MASFKMRVPDDELASWQRAADSLGLSIAAYVRARVSGRIAVPPPNVDTDARPTKSRRRTK